MGGWDTSDLDRFVRDLSKAPEKTENLAKVVVKKIAFDTVAGAQSRVRVDTGNLKNSIGQDFTEDGMGFEAGPTANYGADIEYGTRPHEIKARNAKTLHYVDGDGLDHFPKRVWHPGTAPYPYMRPAFDAAITPLDDIMGQVGKKAIE